MLLITVRSCDPSSDTQVELTMASELIKEISNGAMACQSISVHCMRLEPADLEGTGCWRVFKHLK
jgi:hypothetical protein